MTQKLLRTNEKKNVVSRNFVAILETTTQQQNYSTHQSYANDGLNTDY